MSEKYLDTFIQEGKESIDELNNALLELESGDSDGEAVDAVFRTAHTLKGNFAAMGFENASNLAHAVEDLLDDVRQGTYEPTPETMDLVFEAVDRIELMLDEIEESGEPTIEVSDTVAGLREAREASLADAGDDSTAADVATESGDSDDTDVAAEDPLAGLDAAVTSETVDGRLHRLTVETGDGMPGVDGMLVLNRLTDDYDLLGTDPDPTDIEDGKYDGSFVAYVAADDDPTEGVAGLSQVERVEATDVTDSLAERVADVDADDTGGDDAGDEPPQEVSRTDEIQSVRVDVGQLDELHGLVEQLVTSRIKLRRTVDDGDQAASAENLDELDKITSNLQSTAMDMRLIPVKKAVNKFPRLVRDLSRRQGKDVDFTMTGTDVELDRTILDEVSDPLMHVLRNAVDHGIEPPAEREADDKPRTGTIELRATRQRDHVVIEVEDDGGGLDVERIRQKAKQEGVRTPEELERMDDSEVYDLVYHPGFSTNEEVTDVSGRGVGMDVVHKTVSRLDGSVSVDSAPGEGTTVGLRLPVSVAIVKVLFVKVGPREFGIPIKNVDEIARDAQITTVDGREVVSRGGGMYPLIHLDEALDVPDVTYGDQMYLYIRESARAVVLRCEDVIQQEEVVIKPFQGQLSDTGGLSGTAVIGDGNIVPILDVVTL